MPFEVLAPDDISRNDSYSRVRSAAWGNDVRTACVPKSPKEASETKKSDIPWAVEPKLPGVAAQPHREVSSSSNTGCH
jgi:hypothetical protein